MSDPATHLAVQGRVTRCGRERDASARHSQAAVGDTELFTQSRTEVEAPWTLGNECGASGCDLSREIVAQVYIGRC